VELLTGWSERREARRNLRAARRALRGGGATGFVTRTEPRSMGSAARGRQLVAGNLLLARTLVELGPEAEEPWSLVPPSAGFAQGLHGFGWVDDLAALGGMAARAVAQRWLAGWIDRYGAAPGRAGAASGAAARLAWSPDLAGRRLIRWVHHGPFLLAGPGRRRGQDFFACAAAHAGFLAERWPAAAPGLPRIEALTGLLYAGLSLTGMGVHVGPALSGLARDCDRLIDAEGALPGRNPEELLAVFTLLGWAAAALQEAAEQDEAVPPRRPDAAAVAAIAGALDRMAPTLRALRHADGGLARFHGGGAGAPGALDLALAEAAAVTGGDRRGGTGQRRGAAARPRPGSAMGFARLAARRVTVIADAAAPPAGPDGHASTLAFELTSGRRPVIVNVGPGAGFGPGWHRAARATGAHSTLELEGWSSSRLGAAARAGSGEPALSDRPGRVTLAREGEGHGAGLVLSHDGYARSHGLVHVRRLALSEDGRTLMGEDALIALEPAQKRRFDAMLDAGGLSGIGYAVRFHLHPDVDAALDLGGRAVSLALRSGEVWVFRAEGATPALEPSVRLEAGRLHPRHAQQIVLSGRAMTPAVQIGWTVARAQDSPAGLRDVALDEEGEA
jgi:uncharacterized heparinase superfamily protein